MGLAITGSGMSQSPTSEKAGHVVCGAQRKGGRGVCQARPEPGRTRCKWHGGKSLQGIASPTWKHGKYSKFRALLPTGLAKHYEEARRAELGLADEIALVDARVMELFEQMREGAPPEAWARVGEVAGQLRQAYNDFQAARRAARLADMTEAFKRIDSGLEMLAALAVNGVASTKAWKAVMDQLYLKNKLVGTEVRRRRAEHEALDRQKALQLFAYIGEVIVRRVVDPREKQAILDDLRPVLMPAPASEAV